MGGFNWRLEVETISTPAVSCRLLSGPDYCDGTRRSDTIWTQVVPGGAGWRWVEFGCDLSETETTRLAISCRLLSGPDYCDGTTSPSRSAIFGRNISGSKFRVQKFLARFLIGDSEKMTQASDLVFQNLDLLSILSSEISHHPENLAFSRDIGLLALKIDKIWLPRYLTYTQRKGSPQERLRSLSFYLMHLVQATLCSSPAPPSIW